MTTSKTWSIQPSWGYSPASSPPEPTSRSPFSKHLHATNYSLSAAGFPTPSVVPLWWYLCRKDVYACPLAQPPSRASRNSRVFPTGASHLWLTCLLARRKGIGCLDRVFATHESPWMSQAPWARYKSMWTQQREEEACCLAALASYFQGEMRYLCLRGLMKPKHVSKVGDEPDFLPT